MGNTTVRGVGLGAACALLFTLAGSGPARAGTITLSYDFGGVAVEPHTISWVGVTGTGGIRLNAFRDSAGASFGAIAGATVYYLALAGGPTHGVAAASTYWTVSGPAPAPGVPSAMLPSIMGMFSGLNAAGTSFFPGGGFVFAGPGFHTTNASVGQANSAGANVFNRFLTISGTGGSFAGSGFVYVCFSALSGMGPCTAGTTTAVPSNGAGVTAGFRVSGMEVGRDVMMEPVPEPSTAMLLAMALVGLAGVTRWLGRA